MTSVNYCCKALHLKDLRGSSLGLWISYLLLLPTLLDRKAIKFPRNNYPCYVHKIQKVMTVESRYLEHVLSRISCYLELFFPFPSAFTVYRLINCLTISNSVILKHSLFWNNFLVPRKHFCRYLYLFRRCSS